VLLCGLTLPLLTGCSSLTALALAPDPNAGQPEAPRTITNVKLEQANFHVQKLNAIGHDQGFKLLSLFTIVPASRVKAMTRMYTNAKVEAGGPLTPANITVEQIEQSYILFSIPEVYVRGDFVVFEKPSPGKRCRAEKDSDGDDSDCDGPE
jgi:hypothetical protein